MFEAVIFDWDGTLADTKRAVIPAFQKILGQLRCEVSDDSIERRIGTGAKNTFRETLEANKIRFDDRMLKELVEKKIQAELELAGTVKLFEGSIDLLESLNDKVKMALASMNNRKIVDNMLDQKKIRKYFEVILTADEVGKPKPDPEIFLKCAIKLNCQPENCVVVEDSIFGVKSAKQAKMKCIAVPTGAYSREELKKENPDLIVGSLKEREKILNFVLTGLRG